MKKRKQVCIFDFDGTLVDSMGTLTTLAAEVLHEHYQLPREEGRESYRKTSGLPFLQQLEILFPGDPRNEKAAGDFEKRKRSHYFKRSFYHDVEEIVDYLKERGVKVVVSSGNHQEILVRFLEQKKLDVDLVLGYRPNFLKGEKHFRHIARTLKIGPTEMVFVGDSLHDARSAWRSDIDFIGKEGLFSDKEFRKVHPRARSIKNLKELKEIL